MEKQTGVQIVMWSREDEWLEQIINLYQKVWNIDTDCTEQFKRHMTYEGFRGRICLDEEHKPIAFAYGYASLPGQYYHELLSNHLKADLSTEWLTDCFEFVELCVHPSKRQLGIGTLLHEHVLKDMPYKTSVLTTQQSNLPARMLYEARRWIVVDDSFIPNPITKERYLIYGKKLN